MATPRTIRFNNPFALIQTAPDKWQGLVPGSTGFLQFDSVENGARAGMITLINTYLRRGRDTIGKIIPVYAPEPEAQKIENYIAFLENKTGMHRDDQIKNVDQFLKLAKNITWFEAGKDWVSEKTIANAYNKAVDATGFSVWAKAKVATFRFGILALMGLASYGLYRYLDKK